MRWLRRGFLNGSFVRSLSITDGCFCVDLEIALLPMVWSIFGIWMEELVEAVLLWWSSDVTYSVFGSTSPAVTDSDLLIFLQGFSSLQLSFRYRKDFYTDSRKLTVFIDFHERFGFYAELFYLRDKGRGTWPYSSERRKILGSDPYPVTLLSTFLVNSIYLMTMSSSLYWSCGFVRIFWRFLNDLM